MRTVEEALGRTGREIREEADRRRLPPWNKPRLRKVVGIAAAVVAAVALITAIGIPALWVGDSASPDAGVAAMPDGFGTWETMAEAPIRTRPHAVSVWTGTEAVFWAGSSLSRGFAYTDGAAYDPVTGTWHSIPVPGWGHPGLTGVYFDGALYALAKGGGTRFDPTDGAWSDLPPVDGMLLAAAVATDDAVWGLGPTTINPDGQTDVAIARLDAPTGDWVYGPVFEGTEATGSLFQNLLVTDQPALWTGSEIVLWNPEGGGVSFNPATDMWQQIPAPSPESGTLVTAKATVANDQLVVVADINTGGEDSITLAAFHEGAWTWTRLDVAIAQFDQTTIAAAGDWILLFEPDQAPIIVHVASGNWTRDTEAPLPGSEAPNTVWTGDNLIVWGGANTPTTPNPSPADGAIWTPPHD